MKTRRKFFLFSFLAIMMTHAFMYIVLLGNGIPLNGRLLHSPQVCAKVC